METERESSKGSVVIVGAGIVGIACAHYLVESGHDVTIVDRETIGGACSYGNLGFVCPSHVLPLTEPGAPGMAFRSLFNPNAAFRVKPRLSLDFVTWMLQFARRCNHRDMLYAAYHLKQILDFSMDEFRRIEPQLELNCEWRDSGLLFVLQSASGLRNFAEEVALLHDEFGVVANKIDGEELPEFDAAFKNGLAGAYHFPRDAFLRPDLLGRHWAARLKNRGVTFIENCEMQQIDSRSGEITALQTTQGEMRADQYVFATGAWSAKLGAALGCRIPVEPGKGYSVTMARPEVCPMYPMLFPEHKVGVAPFASGYRLGSMMEFVGFDQAIPEKRIEQLRRSAQPYLVEPYTQQVQETWYGWRPMTWDSLPIIGRVPRMQNALLATGHNMLGVSLAPGTGRLVAEIIAGQPTQIEVAAYSPQRFN